MLSDSLFINHPITRRYFIAVQVHISTTEKETTSSSEIPLILIMSARFYIHKTLVKMLLLGLRASADLSVLQEPFVAYLIRDESRRTLFSRLL
jgi:hypothetical protein